MPTVDMPLEKLREYQGINPRPQDFDAFWDAGLAEMRAVDPAVEVTPVDFNAPYADCYDMTFTGVKGARVYAKLAKPKGCKGGAPALLLFHGYSGNSGGWIALLPYVAAGFVVAALDCRGQAGRSEDVGGVKGTTYMGQFVRGLDGPADNMLMRNIFLDTAQLAKLVSEMPEVDPARMAAHGGSQGGALTIACAALHPGIARLAPFYPFLSDYKRVWEMDLYRDGGAYQELNYYFRNFDPRHEREDEIFEKLGYIDIQNLAKRVKGRVLMATALMDNICPPSTQFAMYNKLTTEKELLVYPDFGHEALPGFNDMVFEFLNNI